MSGSVFLFQSLHCLHVFKELFVERMSGHGLCITQDDKLHTCPRYSNIHATKVAQEANLSFIIRANQRDDDDIPLLPLKTIYRIDGNKMPVRLIEFVLLDETTQVLHLCAIRRDDANVYPLFKNASLSDFCEVLLQLIQRQFCFYLVNTSKRFTDELFVDIEVGGVYPDHWQIIVQDATVLYLRSRLYFSAIEPVAGEPHDLLVHAVLHLQQQYIPSVSSPVLPSRPADFSP